MIRHDIMKTITREFLIENSIPFREGVDQVGYQVIKIKNEVLCWNTTSGEVMDYFYDDINQEWFDIKKYLYPEMNVVNAFLINRKGEFIKQGKQGTQYKTILFNKSGYPMYSIPTGSYTKDKKVMIHRMLAKLFIPVDCPETKTSIDHINRNILDYSLSNLRWVTVKENNSNKSIPKYVKNHRYEAYFDKELTKFDVSYTEEELYNSDLMKHPLCDQAKAGKRYRGRYWKIVDVELENYLLDGETIDSSLWVQHYSGNFSVHPLGIINGKRGITLGSKKNGYRQYLSKLPVHRLVAEVFLNNNQPLSSDLQVDHIDTDPLNNRVTNLRICTRVDNMNNPSTRKKLRKQVYAEGKIFGSITECAKFYGLKRQAINYRIKSKFQPEFRFI